MKSRNFTVDCVHCWRYSLAFLRIDLEPKSILYVDCPNPYNHLKLLWPMRVDSKAPKFGTKQTYSILSLPTLLWAITCIHILTILNFFFDIWIFLWLNYDLVIFCHCKHFPLHYPVCICYCHSAEFPQCDT